MELTELQIHIEEIQWDEEFQLFYERASSGNPDYVFDLFMVNYLDHNCTMKGIDFEFLTYCALNGHSLATELSNAYSGGFSEEYKHKMLAYYKINPLMMGCCYGF